MSMYGVPREWSGTERGARTSLPRRAHWGAGMAAALLSACAANVTIPSLNGEPPSPGRTGGSTQTPPIDPAAAGGRTGSGGGADSGSGAGGSAGPGGQGGNAAGSAGSVGSGGSGGPSGSLTAKPPCLASGEEAIVIGDSYVTGFLSPALQPSLAAIYPLAGKFRNYAVAGFSLASGGFGQIGPQLDQAVAANANIKLMVADGGGNDILLCDGIKYPNCSSVCNRAGSSREKVCTDIVDTAISTADSLLLKAADKGVKDVLFFFYPHITASGGGFKEVLDYAEPLARKVCSGAFTRSGGRMRCTFVSLVQPFLAAGGDLNPANFAGDGIHPSQTGQDIIAKEIVSTMKSHCLGQPASSGCCAP